MLRRALFSSVLTTILLITSAETARAQEPSLSASLEESCDFVRKLGPEANKCIFVREHCPSDSLIPYLQIFYCHIQPSGIFVEIIYQAFCVFLLLLIFRLLGSTADDFFSPILTQISQDLGLPPRFAGVTLLALGNGAPDLVAAIAFVRAGQYRVAISGLLGGGMFVGAAVAGVIISIAGGVKARGALLRDVSCYILAVLVVAIILKSGSFTWPRAALLLVLYLLFVIAVLAADIFHIVQTRNGRTEEAEKQAERPLLADDLDHPPTADLSHLSPGISRSTSLEMTEARHSHLRDLSEAAEGGSGGLKSGSNERSGTWSVDGQHLTYSEKLHMSGQAYREMALAEMANSTTFFGNANLERARRLALLPETTDEAEASGYVPPRAGTETDLEAARAAEPSSLHAGGQYPEDKHALAADRGGVQESLAVAGSPEEDRQARVEQWCASHGPGNQSAERGQRDCEGASPLGRSNSTDHADRAPGVAGNFEAAIPGFVKPYWQSLGGCFKAATGLFSVAEYPLTILRRLSVPLVDTDSYHRKWFIAASIGTPTFVLWYCGKLSLGFSLPLGLAFGAVLGALSYTFTTGNDPPEWSLGLHFPIGAAIIAGIGFLASAMWIDTIAGELVTLLEFFGTLSGIPHEVLGLTVLAWGNSIGDLSTNTAMAKRGLSNMAMTACFAGPIFNLLAALGVGFIWYLNTEHLAYAPVKLMAVDIPAVAIISINGVLLMLVGIWHGAWVPAWYGVVPMILYALYIATSLAVAFG